MLTPELLKATFEAGLAYDQYVATGSASEQENWNTSEQKVSLAFEQTQLIAGFTRRVNLIVSSGTWCGDCVQQVPILRAFEQSNPERVCLRLVDRDEHPEFSSHVKICGGGRVPAVVFATELFDFVSVFGDKTLTRFRALAAAQLGPACPLPGAGLPPDQLAGMTQDWLNELERVHLMCRLSGKLRQLHND